MKANHKHEYIRIVTYMRMQYFDGTITKEYKFSGPAMCIDCGHRNRKAYKSALEIVVSPKEYKTN